MVASIVTFLLGVLTGWLVFERPQWVRDFFTWVRGKLSKTPAPPAPPKVKVPPPPATGG